jgi:methenyltetrahydrofolate cyclohydrolase
MIIEEITNNLNIIEIKDTNHDDYLSMPAKELLEAFGLGNHIPGSGSATALSALIAVELMKTVLKLSIKRPEYKNDKIQFEFILNELETLYVPKLKLLFNKDIQIFHQVSYNRRLRDNSVNNSKEKEEYNKIALDKLREATNIPIDICKTAIDLIKYSFRIFDNGFKSARGDSGVAISNLLSSIQGALFVVFLNLKTITKSKWKDEKMREAVELAVQFTKIQKDAFKRVVILYNENSDDKQLTLDFYGEGL